MALKTLEEFKSQAVTEIENEGKETPLRKSVNGTYVELNAEELDALADQRAEYYFDEQNNGYKAQRQTAYPNLAEQFDMLWHSIDSGSLDKTSDFYKELKKVKDDNPKPE
jgi:4-hydroxyphenylpyruvate dioxygenase-like putative hemolysin